MCATMIFMDLVLVLLSLGHHSGNPEFWTQAAIGGALFLSSLIVISLLYMLARVVFASSKLTSLKEETQTVLGKPLLFPVKFRHIRLSPIKDRFNNRFLLVGVPVGLRCRIGNLLAVDDKTLNVSPPPGGAVGSAWNRITSHLSCWFSVDSSRFLHRGDHGLDLREKLDNFLKSQEEDPTQWPYAYLLGVPQFLGWSRSVVSWWYLYNEDRELDALILEINNSYWEKRNILLRVKPNSDKLSKPPEKLEQKEYLDHQHLVQSLATATKSKFYGGEWHKYIFASPFEKVDGVVSQRMMDPLKPSSWAPDATFSNMTTLEDTGEVRMATRLTCDGSPIDPTQISPSELARITLQWTFPGIFTTPEIIYKALKLRFSGRMKMNSKPPVRSGSVGRHITRLEIDLEPFFRAYLAHCVSAYPEPVELTYLPCRSFTNETIRMRSPSYYGSEDPTLRYLTVEPTDPSFYTRITTYSDAQTAMEQETQPTGHAADPSAQRLLVSNVALLNSILEYSPSPQKYDDSGYSKRIVLKIMLSPNRPNSNLSFMDKFVLSPSNPEPCAVYMSSSIRLSAARVLAFGSEIILQFNIFAASCLIKWLVLEALSLNQATILSVLGLSTHTGWQRSAIIAFYCFFLLEYLDMTKNKFIRHIFGWLFSAD